MSQTDRSQSITKVTRLGLLGLALNCGGERAPSEELPAPARLTIAPLEQDYGMVLTEETSPPATFTVTNEGETTSTTLDVTITDDSASDFVIGADECSGTRLAGGETCEIAVVAAPDCCGHLHASLVVASEALDVAAHLTAGAVDGGGYLAITPTPFVFGETMVGQRSEPAEFTVSHTGSNATEPLVVTLDGGDAMDFSVLDDSCSGLALRSLEACTLAVVFRPAAAGERSTALQVSGGSEVVAGSAASAALLGTGFDDARLSVRQESQNFRSVSVSTRSNDVTFTVNNDGDVDSGPLTVMKTGANSESFIVSRDECTGGVLPPDESCDIVVHFEPLTTGDLTSTLAIAAAPGGTVEVVLSGTGLTNENGVVSVEPIAQDFGSVVVGEQSAARTFSAENVGGEVSGTLEVSVEGSHAGDFLRTGGDCHGQQLPAGETCTIEVVFAPTMEGTRTAELRVSVTLGATASVSLSGTGQN